MKMQNSNLGWKNNKILQIFFLGLVAINLMLLTACEIQPQTHDIPVVHPNQCVKDWLSQTQVPGCALDYLDLIAKQQKALEDGH